MKLRHLMLPLLAGLAVGACSASGTGTGTGGAPGTGGTTSGNAGTGGAPGIGGVTGSGGMAAGTGGRTGTGGMTGIGGRAGTGGMTGTGGRAGTGGTTGTGGATGTDGGASTGACTGDKSPNPDVATSCNPANAKSGAACTQNCCIPCGIDSLGAETCTCTNDKYAACQCPRPARWTALGGECGDSACLTMGGPCMPQGYSSSSGAPGGANILDGQDCVMNGNVCFTAEADGNHGCVCASTPSGDFVMRCGPVNSWFSNNGVATPY